MLCRHHCFGPVGAIPDCLFQLFILPVPVELGATAYPLNGDAEAGAGQQAEAAHEVPGDAWEKAEEMERLEFVGPSHVLDLRKSSWGYSWAVCVFV
jgi:hypothetical protein